MQGRKTCARRQEKKALDRARWGVYLATFMMPQKDKVKDEVISKH
jgi:hypothetical protein